MTNNDHSSIERPAYASSAGECFVVGLGASAGGIRALKQFFARVRPDTGMAYVVILHLSPDHESNLAQVLQSSTALPVAQVRKRTPIEPDHIYVVSPNNKLSLVDGHIDVSEMIGLEERRAPVDMFFRTLADSHHAHAISVILSGTGADGSMGMKRVKEYGGLCVAQEPNDADFGDMPRSAIATGYIDYVLPAVEMPARLLAYIRHLDVIEQRMPGTAGDHDRALVDIFGQLRLRTGHDFANYKRSTVMRRIERRMHVHELTSLPDYASYMRENRDEARSLLKDLLISVTNFFRDPEAFAALEGEVIPKLFENKGPGEHVRVWVAGCATGEEAYSLAMLLSEYAPDPVSGPMLQIFATDIDDFALARARAGLYTINDAADVSPDRLRRFFVKEGDAYRVRRELREIVLFASHNVIKDPPFSHLDLVTCRNLLIYLNPIAQERIVRLFHFGLNAGGYLFLGSSESPDEANNLFLSVDKEHHIFQARSVETPLAIPPVGAVLPPFNVQAVTEDRAGDTWVRERLSYQELHQRLLERYAPPSLVVNQDYDILHLSERVGRFLQFVGGEPSQNLLKVVRPELRLELHSALYHAAQHKTTAEAVAGPLQIDGTTERVRLVVSPAFSEHDATRGMILVVFAPYEPADEARPVRAIEGEVNVEPIARQLEEELVRVKLQLRNTIEQHELQQEELKASNEELQAMNEELRSSSEELETSKEELQSVNEELTTVNQELKIKIEELSQANNDTRNLMNSTDLATVFVDRAMRIKLFTPRARSIFNLLPSDAGRPLFDIAHKLVYPDVIPDIEHVLDTLTISEREVKATDDHWYIARILPYRTAEDRIAGVVLTFTDITERKRTEEALRESEARVRHIVNSVPDYAIISMDTEGCIQTWNTGARAMFGYTEQEAIAQHGALIFVPEDREAGVPEKEMQQARETGRAVDERWHLRKDGTRLYVSGVLAPLVTNGRLVGYTKVARDLTEREQSDAVLRAGRAELELRVEERTHDLADANEALRLEIRERAQSEEMRLRLLRQLVGAQEQERTRISRELHDQLGQEVTALGLKLAALKSSKDLGSATRSEIERLQTIVKQLDSDVEFLVWELRPTGLDDLGLGEALADYCASWSKYFGVPAELDARLKRRLPAETETVLYRIAQEALNNVAKHASATRVDLVLEERDAHVCLVVKDDGVGFDAAAAMQGKTLGLVGMRERAALIGGTTEIVSTAGAGATVSVRVPV